MIYRMIGSSRTATQPCMNTRTRGEGEYKNKTAHCLKSGHYVIQRQYWWAVKFRATENHVGL
jgi:hypothetical protein